MRKITFLFAMLFAGAAMAQIESKTLVKTFDTAESTSVKFNFKNKEVKTESWPGGAGIRVELEIRANMPTQILDELVKAGRYSLDGLSADGSFVVNAPNLEKTVTIRGTDLQEEIIVHVKSADKYLVQGGVMEKDLGLVAARGTEAEAKAMKKFNTNIECSVRVVSTMSKQPTAMKLQRGDILIGGEPIDFE